MNCLVIGYGSIGIRHAKVLSKLGAVVSIVTSRTDVLFPCYKEIEQALNKNNPDYVIIANQTNKHYSTVKQLLNLGFQKKILIEKPLFQFPQDHLSNIKGKEIYVAYNLRFHPLIQELYHLLQGEEILTVTAYVGQYLPNWRPQTNYQETYSAKQSEGGGVLRDLSHELDYLSWIFGPWKQLTALGGCYSQLQIDSDDAFSLLIEMERCPIVSLQLNYLDRISQRQIIVNTNHFTITLDLIKGTFQVNDQVKKMTPDRDYTYQQQHLAIWNDDRRYLCSYQEGYEVVKMLQAAEDMASSKAKRWVVK